MTARARPPSSSSRSSRAPITRIDSHGPRRIAVLGAGGFIGSHLVPVLAARPGTSVIAVDRTFDKLAPDERAPGKSNVERIRAGIEDPGLLEDVTGRADVVISLTALCNPALYNTRPLAVIDANYTDLVPLVKLCAARRRWLIHFSTCEVYGRSALDGAGRPMARMDEDTTALCLGPIHRERWTYAAAKQLLERVIWAHGLHEGLKFTIVRPFNVIGPRMDFIPGVDGEGIPRVLASFMHALLARADLLLVDGGRQRRSFIDVSEFVDAVVRLVQRPQACGGQIVNLGSASNDVTIRQLATAVVAAFRALRPDAPAPRLRNVSAQSFYGAGYDDSIRRIPSVEKAERLLGWRARRSLAEMLPAIVADYLSRYEAALSREARVAVR
ncbi:MAG TPA: NAD-dependent epimerase/dehydratase family protein [Polyangia bacterium]|jgi:UDP-apiose/xylose synthase